MHRDGTLFYTRFEIENVLKQTLTSLVFQLTAMRQLQFLPLEPT